MRNTSYFFALLPPESLQEQLEEYAKAVVPEDSRQVHQPDFHLTLAYLGQLSPEQLEQVVESVKAATPLASSFSLSLGQVALWSHIQLMWLGVQEKPAGLLHLVEGLNDCITASALTLDDKLFVPHVTLARRVQNLEDIKPRQFDLWPVERFFLMQSVKAPERRYAIVETFPLLDK